jgi:hypothetical protein
MISAGHLRTGYNRSEGYAQEGPKQSYVSNFEDMWHNPADTIYTLARAYPHLPSANYPGSSKTWKARLKEYMQGEFNNYKPYQWSHMGVAGAHREVNNVPGIHQNSYATAYKINSSPGNVAWEGWTFNPFNFYALWKYAEIFNNPKEILSLLRSNGNTPKAIPSESFVKSRPHVLNTYIAGYIGYLNLQQMAGESQSSQVKTWLSSSKNMRVNHLNSVDPKNLHTFESGGFLWLVPELGDHLYQNSRSRVAQYVNNYNIYAPYWMVAKADEASRIRWENLVHAKSYNETGHAHYYDYSSLFNAKAFALKEGRDQLELYLDAPAVARGDLFYIQNLVSVIEAGGPVPTYPTEPPISPTPIPEVPGDGNGDGLVNGQDFIIWLTHYGQNVSGASNGDYDDNNRVEIADYIIWIKNY